VSVLTDEPTGMTTVTGERRQPAAKELAENERSPSNGDAAQDATPAGTLGAPSHKLWGGRFSGGPAPALEAVNRSIGTDYRLWPFDIRLSKAWAVALWNARRRRASERKA
jgi:hypothetical protein